MLLLFGGDNRRENDQTITRATSSFYPTERNGRGVDKSGHSSSKNTNDRIRAVSRCGPIHACGRPYLGVSLWPCMQSVMMRPPSVWSFRRAFLRVSQQKIKSLDRGCPLFSGERTAVALQAYRGCCRAGTATVLVALLLVVRRQAVPSVCLKSAVHLGRVPLRRSEPQNATNKAKN